jgi:NAD(P)H dehydrogenase (quinone)
MGKVFFLLRVFIVFFIFSLNGAIQAKQEPQRVLLILAHPSPESFNHSIARQISQQLEKKGYEVQIRDLYALGFDPILDLKAWSDYQAQVNTTPQDILEEQKAILWADHLIFVYPTWWWSQPAILKGYFDRVFTPSFAFDSSGKATKGNLSGKQVTIIQTTGAPDDFVVNAGMDEAVKKLMQLGVFNFLGMEILHHKLITGINGKSYTELKTVLEEIELLISQLF